MNKEKNLHEEKNFSKNSILTISKKAGIKSISQCGIDKTKEILLNKIKHLSEHLCYFLKNKGGKTINKKVILDFLESEGIIMIANKE
jgi:histone H3/H4